MPYSEKPLLENGYKRVRVLSEGTMSFDVGTGVFTYDNDPGFFFINAIDVLRVKLRANGWMFELKAGRRDQLVCHETYLVDFSVLPEDTDMGSQVVSSD